jgi:hypothetical protein
MKSSSASPEGVERWFREQLGELWPVALGSLSLRKTRCLRASCYACETGEQHPSYVLYGRRKGRRFALYIPDALAPEVRRCLTHGRAIQDLLMETGWRYVRALKHERRRAG